jgi:MarR family transcriptional regulator, organic hydroperoxide resistance regulator
MPAKTVTVLAKDPAQPKRRAAVDARFNVANRLFFRLYQASNLMHRTGTRAVSGHGATTQQWAVMGALSRSRIADVGMSVKELMALLAVSRQSLTMVLNRMEGLGLVERVRLESDGRIRRIRLTASGRSTWQAMLVDIRAYYDAAIEEFTNEDANLFFTLLDRLTTRLVRL